MPGIVVVNTAAAVAAARRARVAEEVQKLREDLREYEKRERDRRVAEYWRGVTKEQFNSIFYAGVNDPMIKDFIDRGFYRSVDYRGVRSIGALSVIDNPEADSPLYNIRSTNFKNDDAVWIMDREVQVSSGMITKRFKGRNWGVGFASSWDEMSNMLKDMIGSKPYYFNELKRIFDTEEIGYSDLLNTENDPDFIYSTNKDNLGLDDKLQFSIKFVEHARIHCNVYVRRQIVDENTGMIRLFEDDTGWNFDVNRHDIYCGIFPKDYYNYGFRLKIEVDKYDYWEEERKRKEEEKELKHRCAQPINEETWGHAFKMVMCMYVLPVAVVMIIFHILGH